MEYYYEKKEVTESLKDYPLPMDVIEILAQRGYKSKIEAARLLFPKDDLRRGIEDIKDIDKAVSIIKEADPIVIYADYDCDGISAAAIATICLDALGKTVYPYINSRSQGYGMVRSGVDEIMHLYPDAKCIMTVDNGISAHDAIDYAKEKGFTVLVTDHHEQAETLPAADAVVDLKRKDDSSSFKELCGAGICFKIMLHLFDILGKDPEVVFSCLDIAALATIADVVPLLSENRVIAKRGLKMMAEGERPFFKEILSLMKVKTPESGISIGFSVAPAVNSLSRMGEDPLIAHDAILYGDKDKIKFLVESNERRKEITRESEENLTPIVRNKCVFARGNFPEGIIGILAGKLKEEYGYPAIVIDDSGKASARSIEGFDIKDALDKMPPGIMKNYGGHKKAAGLTIVHGREDEFVDEFSKICDAANLDKERTLLDGSLKEKDLTPVFINHMSYLMPFGEGFKEPQFLLTAQPKYTNYMGSDLSHVKYRTEGGLEIIKWNGAEEARALPSPPSEFIGKPETNTWNGNVKVQFIVQ